MPKFSALAPHASHQDGKKIKKVKNRGHQYRDAAKARKHRKTRIKGLVEEVIEPVEPGKARPLKRGPKFDFAKIERKLRAKSEESQPVSTPVEVYDPVNFNVPRVIVPTSEATAKRKQAATGNDDGDTTDVDDSEDVVIVPAGFVEAAEKLGLLSTPAASSVPREELQEPPSAPHAQPDEKSPIVERISTNIETHSSLPVVPEDVSPAPSVTSPSPSSSAKLVPKSVLSEAACNDSQTVASTSSPTYFESSRLQASTSGPQPSIPESFQQAAWPPASQHQTSTFRDNNMDNAQEFHFNQHDTHLGSTSDDVSMEFLGATTMGPQVYSTMWTAPQLQPQMSCSFVGQVTDNNSEYQAHLANNVHQNWAAKQFQPVQNESAPQSAHINQPPFNHAVDPLTAASRFWMAFSGNPEPSQSPTTVPETIKSTPTQSNEQWPQEEPTKLSSLSEPTWHGDHDRRRYKPDNDRGFNPFPNLRGCKNMRFINMNGESDESRVIKPMPSYRRTKAPVGSEMDLINRLRMEAEGQAAQHMSKVEHRKRRREDSKPDFKRIDVELPPCQRRRCEPDDSKLKTPVPTQKQKSRKFHRQREVSLKEHTLPRTPTEWNLWKFCPSISSLADRFFKIF